MTKKILTFIFLCGALYTLFMLPTKKQILDEGGDLQQEFSSLDDYDYRSLAEKLWQENKQESAVAALRIIIDNNLPDKGAAELQLDTYMAVIKKRKSPMGRVKAAGLSFVTGEVNSFEELAGSTAADFFIYGDIRDIAVEMFQEDTDEVIVSLSAVGLLTEFFPPADPATSLLKTAAKTGSLRGPLLQQVLRALTPLRKNPTGLSATQVKAALKKIMPLWEMAGKSKSWSQFSAFLRHCSSFKQVKFVTGVLKKPKNARKLEALLTALTKSPTLAKSTLAHVQKYGQKGMDKLYAVIRKGPAGIQFLVKHPKFSARVLKGSKKATDWGLLEARDWLAGQALKHGFKFEVLRLFVIIICGFCALSLIFPKKAFVALAGSKAASNPLLKYRLIIIIFGLVAGWAFMYFSTEGSHKISTQTANVDLVSPTAGMLSFVLLMVFVALQALFFFRAKAEVEKINKSEYNSGVKLQLLQSAEIYMDLPVYAGLCGTIVAFILINGDPGGSRIVAYVSTIMGIVLSALLRVTLMHPLQRKYIQLHQESEKNDGGSRE